MTIISNDLAVIRRDIEFIWVRGYIIWSFVSFSLLVHHLRDIAGIKFFCMIYSGRVMISFKCN